ncbi:MAG: hypothetical protein ABIH41_00975 [Nanoarchaeota archaeon]
MDKHGRVEASYLLYIPRFIFLVVVLSSVLMLISFFIVNRIDTKELEIQTMITRITLAPDAISYQDPITGRYHAGVVDPAKITTVHLSQAVKYTGDPLIAARVTLHALDKQDGPAIASGTTDEQWFTRWYARTKLSGAGGATLKETRFPTTYIDTDGKAKNGLLTVTIVRPNS